MYCWLKIVIKDSEINSKAFKLPISCKKQISGDKRPIFLDIIRKCSWFALSVCGILWPQASSVMSSGNFKKPHSTL